MRHACQSLCMGLFPCICSLSSTPVMAWDMGQVLGGMGLRPERGYRAERVFVCGSVHLGNWWAQLWRFPGPIPDKTHGPRRETSRPGTAHADRGAGGLGPPHGSHSGNGKRWGGGWGTRLQRGRTNTVGSCLGKVLCDQGHISPIFWASGRAARDRPVAQLLRSPPNEAVRQRGSDLVWS